MLRLKEALGAFILASILVPTVTAHAETYYVSTNGSDSNPGTERKSWKTVAHAVNSMIAGDTTYVRGGTYNEGLIRFRQSGTQAAPIKLLNYPGESPIIDFINGAAPTYDRILIQGSSGGTVAMGWITIQGFEIRHGWEGIKFYGLHNSVIRNNWVHDNINQGILGASGHHNVFDRNIISFNGRISRCQEFQTRETCTLAHGLYMAGNFYTVTNNLFFSNLCHGIQQNGSSSAYSPTKHPGPEFAGASNWVIAHNTFAYQYSCGGIVVWGALASAMIENNIFYENSTFLVFASSATNGVRFLGTSSSNTSTIRNNLAYASGSGGTFWITGGIEDVHYTQSGNLINAYNPGFVNGGSNAPPASPNFALTARSPAIDAGLALELDWTKIDFKGTLRPQGPAPDIGAYEYRADSDAQSPTPVQNVQIR